jgi:hypothetical protein
MFDPRESTRQWWLVRGRRGRGRRRRWQPGRRCNDGWWWLRTVLSGRGDLARAVSTAEQHDRVCRTGPRWRRQPHRRSHEGQRADTSEDEHENFQRQRCPLVPWGGSQQRTHAVGSRLNNNFEVGASYSYIYIPFLRRGAPRATRCAATHRGSPHASWLRPRGAGCTLRSSASPLAPASS